MNLKALTQVKKNCPLASNFLHLTVAEGKAASSPMQVIILQITATTEWHKKIGCCE